MRKGQGFVRLYKEVSDLTKIMKHELKRQLDIRHSTEIEYITSEQAKEACPLFGSFKYIYTNSA